MGKEEKDERAEETRRGKEKKKRDEEERGKDTTGGILHEAGKIFGFGGILKKVEKLPGFKEQLREIDEEIERRLKIPPAPPFSKGGNLKTAEGGLGGARSMPPGIKGAPSREKRPGRERPAQSDISADVFDENDHLLVAADLPGVEEDTIDISLEGDVLTLSFKKEGGVLKKRLKLPCAPGGEIGKTYKNGILEVKIKK